MANVEEVKKWLEVMGYSKPLPENMSSLVNRSTFRLWNDIIQHVRPNNEVETVTSNLILNRLKNKPSNEQKESPHQIDEIINIHKKQALQQTYKQMQEKVQQQRQLLEKLSKKCKVQELTANQIEKQIKEKEQRLVLLNAKKTNLINQISNASESYRTVGSCSTNTTSLTENSSIDSLDSYAKDIQFIPAEGNALNKSKLLSTTGSFRMAKFSVTKPNNKISNPASLYYKRLSDKHMQQLGINVQIDKQENSKHKTIETKKMKKKLFECDELMSKRKVDTHDSTISSIGGLSDSYAHMSNSIGTEMPSELTQKSIKDKEELQMSLEKKHNVEHLQNLLSNNHENLLYSSISRLMRNTIFELQLYVAKEGNFQKRSQMISCPRIDRMKLQFFHLQNEVRIRTQKEVMIAWVSKIYKQKMKALESLIIQIDSQKLQNWIEASIIKHRLQATNKALIKTLDNFNIDDDQVIAREKILSEMYNLKMKINEKTQSLKYLVEKSEEYFHLLKLINEEFQLLTAKVELANVNNDCYEPLLEKLWTKEMKLFENYPLEFQRRCTLTNSEIYYRDLFIDIYQYCENCDVETLQFLFDFLGGPLNAIEIVVFNTMGMKSRMNLLKTLINKDASEVQSYLLKYSCNDIEKPASYINYSIECCSSLNTLKTIATVDVVKEIIYIWLNLSMKNIISPTRTYQDKSFAYYQNILDSLNL